MDDGDDDFGDLYADVEVEATSAINIAPKFSKTQCVNDEIGKQDGDNDRACISIDNDEDEDDDDDLDIVLNNDDDNVKRGDDYTILRNSANLRSGELEDEDDDNLRADELAVGNSRSLYKYLRSQSAAYWHQFGSGSMGPQTAQRFSLPRARNILDVNIDVFEQKPWKHPGADITDYFNFGFNEDSWKLYCNQVDEYRHRGPVSSGTPPSELTQSTEVDRRKGQAIQVEDGIFEHQSSMDVRRQLDRDSDAIQITILDPDNASVPETSNHGDVSGDDITDHLSFSSASEDESVEEKDLGKDWRSGSENHEIHQVALDETIRTSNDEKESNFVTESSEDERNPANHIKSDDACVDRRKAYTHDRCLTELSLSVRPDYHHPEDSNKSDVKRGSDESRYYARRLSDNRKHGDRIYHERSNSPVYKNRAHKDLILKTPHENDYFTSRRSYDKRKSGEYSYHAKHNNGFFPMSDEVHSTFRQGLHAFDPYEENISYLKSEVYSDYYGERFHGYEDRDSERSGANMDQTVFRNSEEDDYYDERRRYVDDNRMMAGDWYHNEKGQNKGGNLYSRNKGEIDEFYLHSGYYDDDTHGESFRSFTYNDRKRDDIEYTRWEFKGTGRNNRMVRSLFSEFDTPSWKNNEESFASRSPEENHINNCRWDIMPKNSFYKRHESHRGQYFESSHREDYMIDIDGHVDVGRKRCHYQSEIEWEDEIKFRHKDAKFCAHRNSFLFGRLSRRKRVVSEPYLEHVEELAGDPYIVARSGYLKGLTDGQLSNECRYNKHKNETFNGSKCSKAHGMIHERRPLSSRNSHLIVGEVKSSEKDKKPEWMDLNTCINDKMARAEETKAIDEGLDIEEGQILSKEVKVRPMIDKTREHIDGSHNQNGKSGFDNTRILEAMAKMEKRRARFNEPVTITRKGSDSSFKVTAVDPIQETGSNKQQRPARKRKWGASNK